MLSRPSDFRSNPPKRDYGLVLTRAPARRAVSPSSHARSDWTMHGGSGPHSEPGGRGLRFPGPARPSCRGCHPGGQDSSRQLNATAGFLIPLRISNPRIGGSFGFDVVDTSTGESVCSTRADAALRPASNMKIVTALTALKVLGPDTRMTTETFVPKRGQVILRGRRHHPHEHRSGESGQVHRGVSEVQPPAAPQAPARRLPSLDLRDQRQDPQVHEQAPVPDGHAPKKRRALKVYVDDSLYRTPKRGPGWTSSYQPTIVRPSALFGPARRLPVGQCQGSRIRPVRGT